MINIGLMGLTELKLISQMNPLPINHAKTVLRAYVYCCGKGDHSWIVNNLNINPIEKFEQAITIACSFFINLDIEKYLTYTNNDKQ